MAMDLSGVTASTGGSDRPEAKGYTGVITKIEQSTSKAGNPMVVISVNIAEGPFVGYFKYDFRQFITIGDEAGLSRLKGEFKKIIEENKVAFPNGIADVDWANFEETALIGMKIGMVLKWGDRGYLELHYLETIEKALSKKPTAKPEAPVIGDNGEGGLF